MKKYIRPLVTVLVGAALIYVVKNFVFFSFKKEILIILEDVYLFVLGNSLNEKKARYKRSMVVNIIIIVVTILFVLIQLNAAKIELLNAIINTLGIDNLIYYVIYTYLGYLFA